MELIHMADIIPLIGIPYPPAGRSSYYIPCPKCDDSPKKKHLNINLAKDVFRCPCCGFHGGVFDLYAFYTGTDRSRVRKELLERLGMQGSGRPLHQGRALKGAPEYAQADECPLAGIDTRNEAYAALLGRLSLASDHRENLLARGLSLEEIDRLGYRSTPVVGFKAFAGQLSSEGLSLSGVPGFYREEDGSWSLVHEYRGILIPVRDANGRIQGLQIRRDNVTRRKFRWVSSTGRNEGCGAEGWTHLAGAPGKELILTEGPMKADVIAYLTGRAVLAVPGVNALTQLEKTLRYLKESGVEHIMTAFDMDFLKNPHVKNGYQELVCLLSGMGYRFGTYIWNPGYKGLDDYVLHCRDGSGSV